MARFRPNSAILECTPSRRIEDQCPNSRSDRPRAARGRQTPAGRMKALSSLGYRPPRGAEQAKKSFIADLRGIWLVLVLVRLRVVTLRAGRRYPLRQGGRALGSTSNGRLNSAWTAEFRGHSFKVRPRVHTGRARRHSHPPRRPRRPGLPSPQVHAHLAAGSPRRLGQIRLQLFSRYFGTVGPSRPRRCPRPTSTPGAGLDANDGPRCRRSSSCLTKRAPAAQRGLDFFDHPRGLPKSFARRGAAGDAHRRAREGALAPRGEVRVRPGAP